MRREIDGDERPKAGLHVCGAKREPLEAAPAAAGGGNRWLRGQRTLRGRRRFVAVGSASLGVGGIAGCRCDGQSYLSGAATSPEGMRSAPTAPTTTTGSPRLYSGASRPWLRLSSRVLTPRFPTRTKFTACHSTPTF